MRALTPLQLSLMSHSLEVLLALTRACEDCWSGPHQSSPCTSSSILTIVLSCALLLVCTPAVPSVARPCWPFQHTCGPLATYSHRAPTAATPRQQLWGGNFPMLSHWVLLTCAIQPTH